MKKWIIVRNFKTRLDAEIARGFLESADINSVVSADDEGGMSPFPMQVSNTGVQLLVDREYYEKAKKLLDKNAG